MKPKDRRHGNNITITTKLNDELYNAIIRDINTLSITKSEWLRMVVEQYINK